MILTHLVQFGFLKGASPVEVVVPPVPPVVPVVPGGGGIAVGVGGFARQPEGFDDPFELAKQNRLKQDVDIAVALMMMG